MIDFEFSKYTHENGVRKELTVEVVRYHIWLQKC